MEQSEAQAEQAGKDVSPSSSCQHSESGKCSALFLLFTFSDMIHILSLRQCEEFIMEGLHVF